MNLKINNTRELKSLLLSNKISLIEKNLLDNNKKFDETIINNVSLIQNTPDVIFLNNLYLKAFSRFYYIFLLTKV